MCIVRGERLVTTKSFRQLMWICASFNIPPWWFKNNGWFWRWQLILLVRDNQGEDHVVTMQPGEMVWYVSSKSSSTLFICDWSVFTSPKLSSSSLWAGPKPVARKIYIGSLTSQSLNWYKQHQLAWNDGMATNICSTNQRPHCLSVNILSTNQELKQAS